MCDELADELLRGSVIDRRVDVVDALIEDTVQHLIRLFRSDRPAPAARRAAKLHRPKSQYRRIDASSPEAPRRNVGHSPSRIAVAANLPVDKFSAARDRSACVESRSKRCDERGGTRGTLALKQAPHEC